MQDGRRRTTGRLTDVTTLPRFDHGYDTSQKPQLMQLLHQYQPHAVGFNGQGLVRDWTDGRLRVLLMCALLNNADAQPGQVVRHRIGQ